MARRARAAGLSRRAAWAGVVANACVAFAVSSPLRFGRAAVSLTGLGEELPAARARVFGPAWTGAIERFQREVPPGTPILLAFAGAQPAAALFFRYDVAPRLCTWVSLPAPAGLPGDRGAPLRAVFAGRSGREAPLWWWRKELGAAGALQAALDPLPREPIADEFVLSGWCASSTGAACEPRVLVDGRPAPILGSRRVPRGEIEGLAMPAGAGASAGFVAAVGCRGLDSGKHTLRVRFVAPDGAELVLPVRPLEPGS